MVPDWCNDETLRAYWLHPERVPLSRLRARRFKKRLWKHGKLSPNFTRKEGASKDGKAIPRALRGPAQRQAFHMERVRAKVNKPITVLSWYRSPSHNIKVGGAAFSQHVFARACDVQGDTSFDFACQQVFRNGGIGTQTIVGGPVRHVDSRRGPARWVY